MSQGKLGRMYQEYLDCRATAKAVHDYLLSKGKATTEAEVKAHPNYKRAKAAEVKAWRAYLQARRG